ncbi:three-helix bundle dimerization domain-containing protein [Microbacterium sp. B2969]|uniref:Three-helix bundle dimerization domain-containing protein n=1 Tax=Microbacterium alkaliflavum TaxID=3248839 RepID=A0ABW7QEU7_9MICO
MSATNPSDEWEALFHVVRRLCARFPDAGEDAVFALVAEELVEFDDAWLRDYIPVLIEGRVQRRLRARLPRAAAS